MCAQSCPTLCDPMDCSPPGSSVPGISQARILEWVAISSSRGSFQPSDLTHVSGSSCIGRREAQKNRTEDRTEYQSKQGGWPQACRGAGEFPTWRSGKEPTCQCRRLGFDPSAGKIPCSRKWQPTPGFLPRKCHGQKPGGLQPTGSQRFRHD